MSVSEYSMRQLPATLINASHILDDWNNMAETPADASPLLKTGVLNNANNNASSVAWRGLRSPSLSSAASHSKLSYLECVVLEIVESERMYVQDLRSIIENYLGKIIDTQELLLRPEQVSALFGNIEDIYELNSELLQDLDSCHNDPVAVAQCFVHRSQDFNIYTQYCNNYPNSVAALTECMRNKQLAKFFRERQEQIRHSLPLGSYLLKPVQRILKYHLLLQEIAKHFDREGDGYEVVEEAIATMTCVAWYINDMKRKHEHAVRLQEIQSLLINWKGPDLTTYGELVLEGTFRVHRVRNERTFFLLDRILLITKKRGDHYIYKSHIPCSSLMLIESTRDSLCFTITHYKHSKQQYNIQAKSVEEKRVWTHHLKRLILENHHAIIPQKAKEAILEMDSFYPPHFKYSPERLKKSLSCQQSEDILQRNRSGRRQSEPYYGRNSAEKLWDGLHSSTAAAGLKGRRKSEPTKQILKQLSDKGLKGKGHKTQEGPKEDHSSSIRERNRIVETVSSVPKVRSPIELDKMLDISSHTEVHLEENPLQPDLDHHGLLDQVSDSLESAENVEELKPLSSEEEEEEDGHAPQSSSILPFSVLDQASIIAERFASSLSRRNSLVHEEGKGYLTPKMASRSSSILSLDGGEKAVCCNSGTTVDSQSCSLLQESSAEPVNACSSAVRSGLVEPDHTSCRRKESMLSQQDRLLLDKIKSYYDYAEHQDANFSVRRRESLSFIPKGLVRNSVFRINSLPQSEPGLEVLKRNRLGPLDSSVAGRTGSLVLSNRPPVALHSPHLETASEEHPVPITEAEFRSPSEMIKVWEEMEQPRSNHWSRRTEDCRGHKANGGISLCQTESYLKDRLRNQENGFDLHEPLLILEDEDLGDIVEEELVVPSPDNKSPVEQTMPSRLPWKVAQELGSCDQGQSFPQMHPHIMQLAQLTEAELTEKVKNKVYQLARQYSLRIKSQKPTMPRRLAEVEEEMKRNTLTAQQGAVKRDKGQKKSTLCLPNYEQIVLQEASSLGLLSSSSTCQKSPKRFSFSSSSISPQLSSPTSTCTLSNSPLSPIMTEKFNWPDVRELRSRYSCQVALEKCRPPLVNRSCSAPEKMVDDGQMQVGFQCSKGLAKTDVKSQQWEKQSCRRKASLDSIPQELVCDTQKELCVTAEASLESNQHVIVMEKLPKGTNKADERDSLPSAQEKLSLKALVERYKSYQDSEECHRHDDDDVQEVWWEKTAGSQHNLVKNLREKFQTLNSTS
ncbi:pleckstrin homology domain-containing family G member 3 isoform X7 [Python bivittatus]|uniref:Pleckstrin homology domain-containing family G member 3 isoform X7 n=1 Tax=Python bivittatus TaxID=176946 RepID=A0A9F5J135_PYTBI|nr:pleckstrin homology domain-containing family G member 3 isoform X7 [Python bivittatus]